MQESKNFGLWLKWTLYCGLGEFFGITAAAILATAANNIPLPTNSPFNLLILIVAVTLSGIIEGTITGYLQAKILSRVFGVNLKRWILLTVAVAVIGWLAGSLPSALSNPNTQDLTQPNLLQMLVAAAFLGIAAGGAFGFAQFLELKRHVKKASRWIFANAIAWAFAMMVIFTAATLPNSQTPALLIVLAGMVSGVLAGLILGAVTGWQLIKFQR